MQIQHIFCVESFTINEDWHRHKKEVHKKNTQLSMEKDIDKNFDIAQMKNK